jgi:serine/threonine protein kinase
MLLQQLCDSAFGATPGLAMNDTPARPVAPQADKLSETAPHGLGATGTVVRPGGGPASGESALGTIGDYSVVKKIGEGGMGAVYLAEDTKLGRRVAIKTMRPELAANQLDRDRFVREARAAATVESDFIVPILHVGDAANGTPFIAMPLLHGEMLDSRLKREPVAPLGLVLKVAREMAEGLAAAHAKGLIHRDIKPANVWLEGDLASKHPNEQVRRCKILDFGLARSVDKEDAQLTASGAILGTPAFMAPELARGEKIDHRADLFSLGVTLYRMAAGELPFKGQNAMAVLIALTTESPPAVRELAPNLPPALADLIDRLMAKEPAGRPQSAAEVAATVRQIVKELQAKKAAPSASSPAAPAPSSSQPMPAYVLPAPAPSPWEGVTEAEPADLPVARSPRKPAARNRTPWLIAAGTLAALALVAAAVIVIKIKNKDGSETEIKVPDGGTVEITKDGRPVVKLPAGGSSDGKEKSGPKATAGSWTFLSPKSETNWGKLWEAHGPQDWKLQDGELFNANANRGWIGTKKEYTDFEIELEYKLSKGTKGNSGIFLRARPEGELSGSKFAEVQLVADDEYKTTGLNCTGAIFNRVKPDPRPVSKVDQWNTAHVLVVGKRVTVTINGVKCVDADVEFPREKGAIGLQQLNSPVYFRNVRVREPLPAGGADRKAAAYVLGVGGTVQINGETEDIKKPGDLPKGDLRLTAISLTAPAKEADLSVCRGCANLTVLYLVGTQIGNQGLAHFRDSKGLKELYLSGTKVDDGSVPVIKQFTKLTDLSVGQTKITEKGVKELAEALPACRIQHDGGTVEPREKSSQP